MSEPFLAEVRMMGFNFSPRSWAFCDGQILPINQNQALYSLLGTTYGGDGRTSFALPDLRGRIPFHRVNGHSLGEKLGSESHTLTQVEMPNHSHNFQGSLNVGTDINPENKVLAKSSNNDLQYSSDSSNIQSNSNYLTNSGGGQIHNNMPPYTTINFCIALQGLFPSRS